MPGMETLPIVGGKEPTRSGPDVVTGPLLPALFALGLAAAACVACWLLTGRVLHWACARRVLAHPELRSSHKTPTPVGGGLAVMAVSVAAGAALSLWFGRGDLAIVMLVASILSLVSWVDDRRGLPPLPRLLAQCAAVAAGLAAVPAEDLAFQGLLPFWLDRGALFLAWLWFVNLYNFIDGIDGITGTVTAMICLGLVGVGVGYGGDPENVLLAAAIGGAASGFLIWNWQPARIFLGDVGSIPLGFIIGHLLILLAIQGFWAAALILPAYSLADATVTLLRRLFRGARIWHAHREHFYQRATRHGLSHAAVVRRVLLLQIGLVALAVFVPAAGATGQAAFLVAGGVLALAGLRWLAPLRSDRPRDQSSPIA